MTALLDARPPGLNAYFRPGNTFTLTLTWPSGSLTGRTFVAALDAASLTVVVLGNVMTVSASAAQTAAAAATGIFQLTETTGAISQDLIVGTWSRSEQAGTSATAAVTVNDSAGEVTVVASDSQPFVEVEGYVEGKFNLGLTLKSWVDAINPGARNHVIALGDSNAVGVLGNLIKPHLLAISGLADGGPGYQHLGRAEHTRTGGWTAVAGGAATDVVPLGLLRSASSTAEVWTWTRPGGLTFDRFTVWQVDDDFLAQDMQYSIDGGAFVQLNAPNAPGPRLAPGDVAAGITTTLRTRPPGNGFPSYFGGISLYQGTTGLVYNDLTIGGGNLDLYNGPLATTGDRLDLFDRLQPRLTIIWTGTNEHGSVPSFGLPQMTLAQFYAQYTRLAQKARAYGDVLMIYPHDSGPNTDPLWTPSWQPHTMDDFEVVARQVAVENSCGYLSIRKRFGTYTQLNARGYMSDAAHLTGGGQGLAQGAINSVLTGYSS